MNLKQRNMAIDGETEIENTDERILCYWGRM